MAETGDLELKTREFRQALLCFINIFLCRREYHSFPVDTGVGRKQHASALAPTERNLPSAMPRNMYCNKIAVERHGGAIEVRPVGTYW